MTIKKLRSRPVLISCLVGVWAIAIGLFVLRGEKPIAVQSKDFLKSIYEGDGSATLQWLFPEEIAENDYDARKVERFHRDILARRLHGFRTKDSLIGQTVANGNEGVAYLTLMDGSGRTFDLSRTVWRTEAGAKGLLTSIIMDAWIADKVVREGKGLTQENILEAFLAGYEEDEKVLRDLGIKGLLGEDLGNGQIRFTNWEKTTEHWRKMLAEARSQA